MSTKLLTSSRVFIGTFFAALAQNIGAAWIGLISMEFTSDQETESYRWLGQSPAMREWIGGRNAKGFSENKIDITNKAFEATLRVKVRDVIRDKSQQTMIRIRELATRTTSHWAKLLTSLILGGETGVCYDGQFFFDTDHTEGKNTTNQSNLITVDISAIPASVHGTTTIPSPQEMKAVIFKSISTILSFKDNENEPMNENANSFLVMVPIPLLEAATSAINSETFGGGETNDLKSSGLMITVAGNARLTWTESIVVIRADGDVKAFIRQNEQEVEMQAQAEGSLPEFEHKEWLFGVDASRNVGYGYWQHAVKATMT